jgi:tetratricopeptide (TPR) repeat protein
MDRMSEALDAFRSAAALDPMSSDVLDQAWALRSLSRADEARALLEPLAQSEPADIDILVNLGHALVECDEIDRAVDAFTKAIDVMEVTDPRRMHLAGALDRASQFQLALDLVDEVLRYHPASSEAHNLRGLVLDHLHEEDAAVAAYDRAMAVSDPDDSDSGVMAWNRLLAAGRRSTDSFTGPAAGRMPALLPQPSTVRFEMPWMVADIADQDADTRRWNMGVLTSLAIATRTTETLIAAVTDSILAPRREAVREVDRWLSDWATALEPADTALVNLLRAVGAYRRDGDGLALLHLPAEIRSVALELTAAIGDRGPS